MTPTLFLPGAGGMRSFWKPVADRLGPETRPELIGWPGFGDEPARPDVLSLGDLVPLVLERVSGDFQLVAQSMGGVVALQVALTAPGRVRSLVLCATSGGIDFGDVEREDWRAEYQREMPESTPRWFLDDRTDLTSRLHDLPTPALVLYGAQDPIVPEAAARRLASLLPAARLEVVPGAGHDMAQTHADAVARHIAAFHALAPSTAREKEGARKP